MKVLAIIFLTVLFACAGILTGCSTLSTAERIEVIEEVVEAIGEPSLNPIDPYTIVNEWNESGYSSIASVPMVYYTNPNNDDDIKYASVFMMPTGILAYTYLLGSKIHLYFINWETNQYEPLEADQEQWRINYEDAFGISIV